MDPNSKKEKLLENWSFLQQESIHLPSIANTLHEETVNSTIAEHAKRGSWIRSFGKGLIIISTIVFCITRIIYLYSININSTTKVDYSTVEPIPIPIISTHLSTINDGIVFDNFMELEYLNCRYYFIYQTVWWFDLSFIPPNKTFFRNYQENINKIEEKYIDNSEYQLTMKFCVFEVYNYSQCEMDVYKDISHWKKHSKKMDNIVYVIFNTVDRYQYIIPLLNDTFELKNDNDHVDSCFLGLSINSTAYIPYNDINPNVNIRADDNIVEYEAYIGFEKYYGVEMQSISQWDTVYWTRTQAYRNAYTWVRIYNTEFENKLTNKKIDVLNAQFIQSYSYYNYPLIINKSSLNQQEIFCGNDSTANNNSNFDNCYYVFNINYGYQEVKFTQAYNSMQLKYTTHALISWSDVLSDSGGFLSTIATVVGLTVIWILYGFEIKWIKRTCGCQCKYRGYAPYQEMNRQQRKELKHYLTTNGYCPKDELVQQLIDKVSKQLIHQLDDRIEDILDKRMHNLLSTKNTNQIE